MSHQVSQGSSTDPMEEQFFQDQDITAAAWREDDADIETDDGRTIGAQTVELQDYEGITTTPSGRPPSTRSTRTTVANLHSPHTQIPYLPAPQMQLPTSFQTPQPHRPLPVASIPSMTAKATGISYPLRYVLQVLLKIPTSSMLYQQDEIINITHLVVMSKEELNEIEANINGINTKITKRE